MMVSYGTRSRFTETYRKAANAGTAPHYLTIIPRARMGYESIAHSGSRNNCFSKIQLVKKVSRLNIFHKLKIAKEVAARKPQTHQDWDEIASVPSGVFSSDSNRVDLKGRGCRERLARPCISPSKYRPTPNLQRKKPSVKSPL